MSRPCAAKSFFPGGVMGLLAALGLLSSTALCADDARSPAAESRQRTTAKPATTPDFSAEEFLRIFASGKEVPRAKALDTLERSHLRDPESPAALAEAVRQADQTRRISPAVFRAVWLLARSPEGSSSEPLVSLLSCRDPRLVMTALGVLVERPSLAGGAEPVLQLVDRPEFQSSYGFRHAVVSATSKIEDPRAVESLISLLPKFDGQLQYETVRQLTRATGEDFGDDAAQWQSWWDANHSGFVFARPRDGGATAVLASNPRMPWRRTLPKFYGIPVYANRVVFVIDRSKSMLSSVDGETRMTRAKLELEQAIDTLPEYTWFNVVAFGTGTTAWQEKLVPATHETRAAALQFVWRLSAGTKTACYDALERAFTFDPNTEAVYFLSDGKPTAGKITDLSAILQAVTQANLFRRASIYTIGIDARDQHQQFLEQLAERNHGEFLLVR